jgi:hypothetical protein
MICTLLIELNILNTTINTLNITKNTKKEISGHKNFKAF